jgi:hypothetical protein
VERRGRIRDIGCGTNKLWAQASVFKLWMRFFGHRHLCSNYGVEGYVRDVEVLGQLFQNVERMSLFRQMQTETAGVVSLASAIKQPIFPSHNEFSS